MRINYAQTIDDIATPLTSREDLFVGLIPQSTWDMHAEYMDGFATTGAIFSLAVLGYATCLVDPQRLPDYMFDNTYWKLFSDKLRTLSSLDQVLSFAKCISIVHGVNLLSDPEYRRMYFSPDSTSLTSLSSGTGKLNRAADILCIDPTTHDLFMEQLQGIDFGTIKSVYLDKMELRPDDNGNLISILKILTQALIVWPEQLRSTALYQQIRVDAPNIIRNFFDTHTYETESIEFIGMMRMICSNQIDLSPFKLVFDENPSQLLPVNLHITSSE